MSWNPRRPATVLAAAALLAVLTLLPVSAQRVIKGGLEPLGGPGPAATTPGPKKAPSYDLGRLTLPKDEDMKDRFDGIEDAIKKKEWKVACETLQKLVGRPQDVFVPRERKDPNGETSLLYVSVKKEAARLIGVLPKAGLDFYKATYGPKAEKDANQARVNNNFQQMAQVLALYLHTDAGAEAADWLATNQLDRANFQGASTFYQILIQRSGMVNLKDGQLVKAAYSLHQAGDPGSTKLKESVLKELERREVRLKLGGEERTVAELKGALDGFVVAVSAENASDSPIYRGRPSRNAMLPGGTPFLQPAWTRGMAEYRTLADDKEENERNKAREKKVMAHVKDATDALATTNKPIFSAFSPVTATATKNGKKIPLLVYRDYKGVSAINMHTGKVHWETQFEEWSLDGVLNDGARASRLTTYQTWYAQWKPDAARPQILFDNSVTGTLSADNQHVYVVEDLAYPAPQSLMLQQNPNQFGGGPQPASWSKDVADALNANKLIAIKHVGGGQKWDLGGSEPNGRLTDSIFLGPPLPLNNKLYALNEKQQELRLVTVEPETGKVLSVQPLASTKDLKLSQDPLRRVQACHLAHGEGVLVIPTNAGAVFGIDLLSGSLAWAYPYGEKWVAPVPQPNMEQWGRGRGFNPNQLLRMTPTSAYTNWQVTAPAIQDGKVVFTAPDARDIHCVNLRDGTRVWTKARQDDDLYMAGVYGGKVVIVGKGRTRALSLNKGEVLWELDTGLPSGQGAASVAQNGTDTIYYLPIRRAVATREPEICAINVDKGLVEAHTRSRKGEVPGNLIFYEGSVLSQTHESVTAYPQLEVKLAELNKDLKDRPDDPELLTDRGDYLLDRGDRAPAIADFRKALRTETIKAETRTKARTKLYEVYTEHFQRDFAKAEEFLKDYEEMCKVETGGLQGEALTAAQADQRRRRANFLCLVGKGRESQNKLVEAFTRYLELGEESQKGELIQVIDEPSVKAAPDVWSQGRISAMVATAKDADQKAAVEKLITARWDRLKADKAPKIDDLRKFVALFGSLFGVGKEARFALAERLMEDTDVNSMLEAEQQLTLLRIDPSEPVAARAIETLARLNTRKGLLEDAAHYYRLLGERYPKTEIDGKKGEDYLEDLATDKRFLPYLDQTGRYTIRGPVQLRSDDSDKKPTNYSWSYPLHNFGEQLPFFLRNRLVLDQNQVLKLQEPGAEQPRNPLKLPQTNFLQIASGNAASSRVKFGYQTQGHLVVLTVGHRVFAVDPLNKGRVIWDRNLSVLPGSDTAPPQPEAPYAYDHRDGTVTLKYPDQSVQRVGGSAGPLQAGVVCLQMRDKMMAVDPVSNRVLWERTDVNSRAHVLGDEGYLYVVGMGESNQATGSRVFRAYDGVSVRVPDFSAAYDKRVRVMGRHILASDADVRGVLTLRIYDILEGKDLWKRVFSAGSVLMQSEDDRLAGVVEPTGEVHIVDVTTQKDVLTAKLPDPKSTAEARSIHLLSDPDSLFLAVNGKLDSNVIATGDIGPNFHAGRGMRSIPVNGNVYSFERGTGALRWVAEAFNENLVVTQFEELPCLFFAARYNKWSGQRQFGATMSVGTGWAVAKHTGKVWWMPENSNEDQNRIKSVGGMYFSGVSMDHRTGKVELIGDALKVVLTAEPKPAK